MPRQATFAVSARGTSGHDRRTQIAGSVLASQATANVLRGCRFSFCAGALTSVPMCSTARERGGDEMARLRSCAHTELGTARTGEGQPRRAHALLNAKAALEAPNRCTPNRPAAAATTV